MTAFLILKYVHILLFVFWLGTDMGTYYSSRFVINPKLTGPQRATALQILLGCDLGPRMAMPLIIPTGIHMAILLGVAKVSSLGLGLTWFAGLLWLGLVLSIHFGKDEAKKAKLSKMDFWMRPIIVVFVSAFSIYSLFEPKYLLIPYLAWKLLIVCALILCGLGIRYHLGIFKPAFKKMMVGQDLENSNQVISKRMAACLPYVYGIWIGLLVNAALGLHLI